MGPEVLGEVLGGQEGFVARRAGEGPRPRLVDSDVRLVRVLGREVLAALAHVRPRSSVSIYMLFQQVAGTVQQNGNLSLFAYSEAHTQKLTIPNISRAFPWVSCTIMSTGNGTLFSTKAEFRLAALDLYSRGRLESRDQPDTA